MRTRRGRPRGGQPVVVDPAGDLVPLLDRVDAVVLSGGPDIDPACYGEEHHAEVYGVDRAADDAELALARAAVERATPTLAICRGLQVLNVALGGTLHQHIPDLPGIERHGRPAKRAAGGSTASTSLPESLLASVFGTTRVTGSCHHHQAVGKVGDGCVSPRPPRRIVEGLEVDGTGSSRCSGIPRTPRTDPAQQRLFDALSGRARD